MINHREFPFHGELPDLKGSQLSFPNALRHQRPRQHRQADSRRHRPDDGLVAGALPENLKIQLMGGGQAVKNFPSGAALFP